MLVTDNTGTAPPPLTEVRARAHCIFPSYRVINQVLYKTLPTTLYILLYICFCAWVCTHASAHILHTLLQIILHTLLHMIYYAKLDRSWTLQCIDANACSGRRTQYWQGNESTLWEGELRQLYFRKIQSSYIYFFSDDSGRWKYARLWPNEQTWPLDNIKKCEDKPQCSVD